MKANHILYITVIAVATMMSSCKEGIGNPPDGVIVSAQLTATLGDRSNIDPAKEYEYWQKDDNIGLYMLNTGHTLETKNIYMGGSNKCYKSLEGSNTFAPNANNQTLNYPSHKEFVDIIGYYPYNAEIKNYNYPIDVSVQENQSAIDLRYSDNCKDRNSDNFNALLVFEHQLTQLHFEIKAGGGLLSADLKNLKIELSGFNTTADFSLADKTISNIASPKTIVANTAEIGKTAEAILIPSTNTGTHTVTFTLNNGDVKSWDIPADLKFERSKRILLYVELTQNSVNINYEYENWDGTMPPDNSPVYNLLDAYKDDDGNVLGMVISLDASGKHGIAISIDERRGNWSTYTSNLGVEGGETRDDMQTLIERLGGADWQNKFESFAWCRAHEGGKWFLPALTDFETIYAVYNRDRNAFNSKLESMGGTKITEDSSDATQAYWTASAKPGVGIIVFNFHDGSNTAGISRSFTRNTRAILPF